MSDPFSISELEGALIAVIRDANACHANGCGQPGGVHAQKCGCAEEARNWIEKAMTPTPKMTGAYG